MNKSEFVKHIANQQNITQDEANKVIDIFTSSIRGPVGEHPFLSFSMSLS